METRGRLIRVIKPPPLRSAIKDDSCLIRRRIYDNNQTRWFIAINWPPRGLLFLGVFFAEMPQNRSARGPSICGVKQEQLWISCHCPIDGPKWEHRLRVLNYYAELVRIECAILFYRHSYAELILATLFFSSIPEESQGYIVWLVAPQ